MGAVDSLLAQDHKRKTDTLFRPTEALDVLPADARTDSARSIRGQTWPFMSESSRSTQSVK